MRGLNEVTSYRRGGSEGDGGGYDFSAGMRQPMNLLDHPTASRPDAHQGASTPPCHCRHPVSAPVMMSA